MTGLQALYFYDNLFSGGLPSSLGQLTALTALNISLNRFTGKVMEQSFLYNMTALEELVLSGNLFSGIIPTMIGRMTSLTSFSYSVEPLLDETDSSQDVQQMIGTVPTEIGLLTRLNHLELDGNRLTGSIPTEIANLGGTLTRLSLSHNNLSGTLPTELGMLSNLGMYPML
jgi:Leucine-rich repeat (LRR) protein